MSLAYTLRESFSGFTRAKLSTFVSIVTIIISLLLLGVFAVVTINATRVIDALREKVEFEVFLVEPLSRQELAEIKRRIEGIEGVAKTVFVSKEDAARLFKEEFGQDISDVLDFNPLPPSYRVSLTDEFKTAQRAQQVYEQLSAFREVDKVIYRKALLEVIDRHTTTVHNLALGLGVLVSISAIFLVSNTIRLAIYAKRRLLRTMSLIGATGAFIRMPFLLEGLMQGMVGGAFATGLMYFLLEYASRLLSIDVSISFSMEPWFYAGLVALGMVLGLIGSIISITRFIRLSHNA